MLVDKSVLFPAEAATRLSCSVQKIYRLIHEHKLKAYKDNGGRAWKIPCEYIEEYIAKQMAR